MAVKIRVDGDVQDFEKKLQNLDNTADKALKGVKIAAAAAGTALVALGTYAFNVGKDFENGMSGVQAVLQTSEYEMEQLTALAQEMGATTAYSATQAAEALQFIAQAGYDAAGAAQLLPDVLNLAATDAMDLGVAAQYVTNGLAIFGEAAGGAAHYSDLLATTAAAADGSVSDMAEAFMVAGGQAMLAGLDMDELATAVGVLANNGIKGSEGGTHLRNALKNLYTPTDDAAAAMEELGIQTRNADGTLVGMQDVLQQFQGQLSGLDQAARLDYMGRIFDTRTLAAANALINSSGDAWDELAVAMGNAEGAAARMAEIKLDNLEGDITLLKSATEGFGIQLYDAFGESARGAVQGLTSTVEDLMRAFNQPDVRAAVASIGEAVGALVKTVGNVVATVLPLLIKALGAIASNLNIVVPAVVALVTALTALKIINTVSSGTKVLTAAFEKNAAAALGLNVALAKQLGTMIAEGIATAAMNVALIARAAATNLATAAANGNVIAMVAYNIMMGIATAATWLFNAALAANPIGLVIAGIVALVAVVAALAALFSRESDALKALKEDTEAVIEANNQLEESMAASAEAFANNVAEIENNGAAAGVLTDKLFETMAAYDGSASSAAKMRVLVAQLNDSVDGLNLAFDEETGQLNMTEEAVRALVAAQKEQLLAQARQARAMELANELVQQEESLRALRDQYAEWELALENGEITQRQFNKNTEDLTAEITEAEAAIGTLNGQIDEYVEASAEASQASEDAAASAAYSEQNLQALADQYGTTVEAIRAATDGTVASLDEWQAAQEETAAATAETTQAMADRYEELAAVSQNVFSRIEQEQALSISQMIGNLDANTAAMNSWAENLGAIRDRTASGELSALGPLVDQIAEMGPEYAAQLAVLNHATDEELAALAAAFETGGQAAMDAMLTEFGLPSNTNMGADAVDEIAAAMEANSALETAATSTVNDAVTAINNAISAANLPGVGRNMVDGIANGVRANGGILASAMTAIVNDAIAAAKAAAEIASPSKRMRREVGRQLPAGMVQGIEDGTNDAVAAAHDQAEAVLAAYGDIDPDIEVASLAEQMVGMFDDVPAEFFTMGETAGAQFVAGFNTAAFGFFALFEQMMAGDVLMAANVGSNGARGGTNVELHFHEPVEAPDTVARSVRNVFEYGLAGERD